MKHVLWSSGAALVLALTVSPAARGEESSPELPALEWTGTPVYLEDLKGQVTVIVFYNDDDS